MKIPVEIVIGTTFVLDTDSFEGVETLDDMLNITQHQLLNGDIPIDELLQDIKYTVNIAPTPMTIHLEFQGVEDTGDADENINP